MNKNLGVILVAALISCFYQAEAAEMAPDSNCTALSDNVETNHIGISLNTVPSPDKPQDPYATDFPLKECLAELRIGLFSHIINLDGTVKMADEGTIHFGERGMIDTCRYQIDPSQRAPADLTTRLLKYEGVLPGDSPEDPLYNYSPVKRDQWSKMIKHIVIISCDRGLSS